VKPKKVQIQAVVKNHSLSKGVGGKLIADTFNQLNAKQLGGTLKTKKRQLLLTL